VCRLGLPQQSSGLRFGLDTTMSDVRAEHPVKGSAGAMTVSIDRAKE
jgi:hypothetical protein